MTRCNYDDPLDVLTNEIEQGFRQQGGWKACRYLLGKLLAEQKAEVERLRADLAAIKKHWQFGVGELNNPWKLTMAELVGDKEGLAEAAEAGGQ